MRFRTVELEDFIDLKHTLSDFKNSNWKMNAFHKCSILLKLYLDQNKISTKGPLSIIYDEAKIAGFSCKSVFQESSIIDG